MSVTSKPLASASAPIDRKYLDTARAPIRVLFGLVFVSYCAISTIIGVQGDLSPLPWSVQPIASILTPGFLLGACVAAAIFIGEALLAEASLVWYAPLLAVDAWYTARWSDWIGILIHAHLQIDPLVEDILTFVVTWAAAILIAYFGERLIFGKRRSKRHD